ncbi:MAG: hypothetical protein DRN06_07665 [Thermoprotei archaeon]|nr:MAG: hypothetical protein DRN06_07665 [Thermoprotei archaeon]
MSPKNIERIVRAYRAFRDEPGFARVVPLDEVRDNDYNLNVSLYVAPLVEREEVDVTALWEEVKAIDREIEAIEERIEGYLREALVPTKEDELKETRIGKIPASWKVARLTDVADYINGYPFSTKDWKDRGLPIIRIQNLNDPDAEFNYFDGDIDSKYIVSNGDILFSWSGSIGVYLWNRGKAVLNQHIFKVVPRQGVNRIYLYYALHVAIEQLKRRVHGSTMKHFRRGELKATYISFPPIDEQERIAEVLSTVDEAISLSRKAIEAIRAFRDALMAELLARGIGHEEFKETEIGRIPVEWEVVRLNDIVIECKTGIPVKEQDRVRGPYPYFGANGIIDWVNGYIFDGEYIIVAQDGSIGAIHYYNGKFWANNHVWVLKCDTNEVHHHFLFYALKMVPWQYLAVGSTRPKITKRILLSVKIPLPSLDEQKRIARILLTVDERLRAERERLERLRRLKEGLMGLLLTGRMRVRAA